MLAGDIIISARTLMPDLPPQTITAPGSVPGVASSGSGNTLSAGVYFLKATYFNQWGETLASAEATVTVTSGQLITVSSPLITAGITKVRIYLTQPGGGAGNENQFVESTVVPFTITSNPTNSGTPPVRATAFNPDMDGPNLAASTIFGWLNDGFKQLSRITGGIKDYSGVGTQSGNPFYQLVQNWLAINNLWYNGWWLAGGDSGYFYRRNSLTSQVLVSAAVTINDDRSIIEVFPQPDRNAGTTTTTALMGQNDTSIAIANSGVFLLPKGFVQIDSEMMAYASLVGNVLGGLVRRIGGNPAVSHANGATVTELNMFFSGRRVFDTEYVPGQATLPIPAPSNWKELLTNYVMYRFRQAEQDNQGASDYFKQFEENAKKYAMSNKQVMKRRQIGPSSTPEAFYPSLGGGILVPIILISLNLFIMLMK